MHPARYYAPRLDFHSALREYHTVKSSGDDHTIALNLAFHFGVLSQNYGLLRDNISLQVAINTKRSRDRQRALDRNALIDEPGPFLTRIVLRRNRPLPCHYKPPEIS